jgi:hypothetical protein
VRLGDALAVARAVAPRPVMPVDLIAVIWAQYVSESTTKQKIAALEEYLHREIGRNEYWAKLDRAHYFLLGRMDRVTA